MSRFDCDDYEMEYPNAHELWAANVDRALKGKRGRRALAELREALLALPEKRLIEGALCTVGHRREPTGDRDWYQQDLNFKIDEQGGEGVCAIGAFIWHKKVKAGTDPEAAFAELPVLLDSDGGGYETASAGKRAGLTYTLAQSLAYRNDESYAAMTPEERYTAFMAWIDAELGTEVVS